MGSICEPGFVSLGDKILDGDHQEIADYLEETQDLIISGRSPCRTGSLLRRLEQRVRVHFALEEGMMRSTRYPASALHQLGHLRMTNHLHAAISLYDRDDLALVRRTMDALSESHLHHVGGLDLAYSLWRDTCGGANPAKIC